VKRRVSDRNNDHVPYAIPAAVAAKSLRQALTRPRWFVDGTMRWKFRYRCRSVSGTVDGKGVCGIERHMGSQKKNSLGSGLSGCLRADVAGKGTSPHLHTTVGEKSVAALAVEKPDFVTNLRRWKGREVEVGGLAGVMWWAQSRANLDGLRLPLSVGGIGPTALMRYMAGSVWWWR